MTGKARASKRIGALLLATLLAWLAVLAWQIADAARLNLAPRADAAIVLGAAVYGADPSPVFEERIRYGVQLYRSGAVRRLIFTGGRSEGDPFAESAVARRYAIDHGVAPTHILVEARSHTTQRNLAEASLLMRASHIDSALIVSDPLHMKRALRMADDLGLPVTGAPTPTTRYRSWRTKAGFLLRELYFYNHYLVTGH